MQTFQPPAHYRPDIDGLRAIAVLAVILFHAFPSIAPGGFLGVDIFFVISGYLISRILFKGFNNTTFSFRHFYAHRIKRIFPALIALLSGCLVMGWFVMSPGEYLRLGYHIAASTLFVQNFLLWNEVSYFDVAAELKPLLHLWSLSVEEQFYLFYPLLLWTAWKARLNLLAMILVMGLLSLGIYIIRHTQHAEEVFFLLHSRFWELLAGGLLAYLNMHKAASFFASLTPAAKNYLLLFLTSTGLILIAVALISTNNSGPDKLLTGLVITVVGSCLLVGAGADCWINKNILANRWLVYIGLISYPLYLWHWSLLSFLRLTQYDYQPTLIEKIAAIALSFVLAWATYQWIEKPFRYGKSNKTRIVILICLLIFDGLAGLYIFIKKGLPSRYPAEVSALATFNYDYKRYTHYGQCWVDRDPPLNQFASRCLGALTSPASRHAVLVWGDSHAAHIYPAIDELFGNKGDVAEFTRSTCPPILGLGMKLGLNDNSAACIAGNEEVFAIIKKYVPDTVILFALWSGYADSEHADRWPAESPIANRLLDTLRKIQSAGVKNIILIGPAPQWGSELPALVLEETLNDAPRYRIPQRLNHNLNPSSATIDADLKALVSQEKSIQYFSIFDTLCNKDGCLVRTSDDSTSITAYDYGHLTEYGARYVAKQLPFKMN